MFNGFGTNLKFKKRHVWVYKTIFFKHHWGSYELGTKNKTEFIRLLKNIASLKESVQMVALL